MISDTITRIWVDQSRERTAIYEKPWNEGAELFYDPFFVSNRGLF